MKLDPARTAALLGAGVSVDAGLPTAIELVDHLVDKLVHRPWAVDALKELARPSRPDMLDEHDVLRFETLLLWIEDVFDPQLELFAFLDEYREPTELGLRLARAACKGTNLITTNFDDLLEQAIAREGGRPLTVDAHGSAQVRRDEPVLKLHGTRYVHRDGRTGLSAARLHATTEVIAAANPGSLLEDRAAGVLRDAILGRDLLVAGYSASDDLDIVPALMELRPDSVVWIDHQSGDPRPVDLAALAGEQSSSLSLLRHWSAQGVPVSIIRGRTADAVAGFGFDHRATTITRRPTTTWRRSLDTWARRVRRQDPTGLGFAGLLFSQMLRHDLADRAFLDSRGSRTDPDAGWTSARRAYEIAQNLLLRDGSDPIAARHAARAARTVALRAGDTRTALFALLLSGRAEFLTQNWAEAVRLFEAATTEAESPGHRAYAQSWLGRTLAWSGRAADAMAPLRAAIRAFRKDGNLEGLLDALDGRGVAELSRGRLDPARADLNEAAGIARDLGWVDRQFTLEVALGVVEFLAGDLDESARHVDVAQSLNQDANDEVSDMWALRADLAIEAADATAARAAVESAIVSLTVITRRLRASLVALRAELALADPTSSGDGRTMVELCLGLPAEESTWVGTAHATALAISWGSARSDDLDAVLRRRPHPLSALDSLRAALVLTRLRVNSPESRRVVAHAIDDVKRMSATRWISQLTS